MARVNVEQKVFADPRFAALARLRGFEDTDTAIGKMARVWNECIERESHTLPCWVVEAIFGDSGAPGDLVTVELAEWDGDASLRIKGTEGRTEYLGNMRRARKRGGAARAAGASRDPKTGAFASTHQHPASSPPSTSPAEPSAPAPAPDLTPDPDIGGIGIATTASQPNAHPRKRGPAYTPGFLAVHSIYPHFEGRTRRPEAFRRWKKLKLEDRAEDVERHLEAWKLTHDWTRDGGSVVPGMQVWLSNLDLDGDPPEAANISSKKPKGVNWDAMPEREVETGTPRERRFDRLAELMQQRQESGLTWKQVRQQVDGEFPDLEPLVKFPVEVKG